MHGATIKILALHSWFSSLFN